MSECYKPECGHTEIFECFYCGYQWVATYPSMAGGLECPNCHQFTPKLILMASGD